MNDNQSLLKVPKRFGVVLARFAFSGVPLAQIRFARALAVRGYKVDLIVGYVPEEYVMPEIEGVNVINLRRPKASSTLLLLAKYLKKACPDAVFTAEDHLNIIVLLATILSGSSARISGSSRVTPYDTYSTKLLSKRWLLKQMMQAVMWRADALTCVSKDMVAQYRTVFRKPPHVCVYNIVDNPDARRRMLEPLEHPWFDDKTVPVCIAAGQLGPWKGFDYLIRAMQLLQQKRLVRLIILGEGPQRQELMELIQDLNVSDSVRLEGNVQNPLKYFSMADLFVLSSLVEGLPNVLVEAMMCGCTPVSTDCPTGPREVLQDGKYGYLVPVGDPAAMAAAIEHALDNPIPKHLLAEAVFPFEESAVIERHFKVLGLC
jgi:glycosyltransferase involved in cell wall biosynthesis